MTEFRLLEDSEISSVAGGDGPIPPCTPGPGPITPNDPSGPIGTGPTFPVPTDDTKFPY